MVKAGIHLLNCVNSSRKTLIATESADPFRRLHLSTTTGRLRLMRKPAPTVGARSKFSRYNMFCQPFNFSPVDLSQEYVLAESAAVSSNVELRQLFLPIRTVNRPRQFPGDCNLLREHMLEPPTFFESFPPRAYLIHQTR